MLCEAPSATPAIFWAGARKCSLKYYVDLAKQLQKAAANLLGIKDMAGICEAVRGAEAGASRCGRKSDCRFTSTLTIALAGKSRPCFASEEGVDIVDTAFASMAGLTSQPSLNALGRSTAVYPRDTGLAYRDLEDTAEYWEDVRKSYRRSKPAKSRPARRSTSTKCRAGNTHEPGAASAGAGLGERWREVSKVYAQVNLLFGDVIKVTPSSKVVGDMALFMLANNLTADRC